MGLTFGRPEIVVDGEILINKRKLRPTKKAAEKEAKKPKKS